MSMWVVLWMTVMCVTVDTLQAALQETHQMIRKNASATIGSRITIKVAMTKPGNGTWYHDGVIITNSTRTWTSFNGLTHQLIIADVRYLDAGNYTYEGSGTVASVYLTIDGVCATHFYNTTDQRFFINHTIAGGTFYTDDLCDIDRRSLGMMKCLEDKGAPGGAYWGQFIFNKVCNFSNLPGSAISDRLRTLFLVKVNDNNIEGLLQSVLDLVKGRKLLLLDLLYITSILEKTTHLSSASFQAVNKTLWVYNYVLNSSNNVLVDAQERGRVANRILEVMDTIADKLNLSHTGYEQFSVGSFDSQVWVLTNETTSLVRTGLQLTENSSRTNLINGFPMSFSSGTSRNHSSTDATIEFHSEFLQQVLKDSRRKEVRLVINRFNDPCLFSVSEKTIHVPTSTLNSKVISAKILKDGLPITNLNGTEVVLTFISNSILSDDNRRKHTVCAFWDFTGNDNTGSWLTAGCRYRGLEDDRDVCVCNHLTNFAVLFNYYGQSKPDTLSLSIITIIGLRLSIFGLSITVLSFVLFSKLRENRPQLTLFNLAVAELCSWVVFLAGINQTQNHVGCIVVAALLHYFILASFMWMLAEAVLHYLLFVKVLGTYTSRYMLKTGIPAWAIPLVPVVVILVLDTKLYLGGEKYCWMSLTPFYFAFALPVGLIILCNIVLYIMVVVSICRKSNTIIRSSESKSQRALVNIRASVFCFVLLGLTWLFGFLVISDARVAFQYIFCITNSLQGFLIFLFFTARNKQVRDRWAALCCRKQKGVLPNRQTKIKQNSTE